jgi:crotonobetainyl-CoA:carnitine CoA-transferase CaiB-like acyl-CoA transferase
MADDEMIQVFSGLRVIDLSRWVSGEFASKLFADFGADVVKVERPGVGSLTRYWDPFAGARSSPEASPLFLHLNTNKRSVELDLATADGREALLALVAGADVLVESFRPGQLEKLGIGPQVLHAINPRLVITRISPFGQSGPYRDLAATGLVLQAMGGPMHATGGPGRPPLRKPGNLEFYTIGRAAAEATMAGLISVRRGGAGPVIDVAGFEALLAGADRRASYLLAGSYSGVDAPRGIRSAHRGASRFAGPFRAADGFVMIYVTNQAFFDRLIALVAESDAPFREKFLGQGIRLEDWEEFSGYMRDWFAARPKMAIMEAAEANRIPLTALFEMSELSSSEHYRSRGLFVRAAHPEAGELDYIGPPWRMAGGYRLRAAAPLLGQHTDEVRADWATPPAAGSSAEPWSAPYPADSRLPLEGVRIVDLTVVWAGAGGTALLGDLGAEVIRLEGNNRISRHDSAKSTKESLSAGGYRTAMFPDREPQPRPYDRSAQFNWHSRNKLAACANLETAEGRAAILELIKISDVFMENHGPGVMEKLGLGHEELLALNPRLIIARMPPMGLTGPMSGYLGYGPNFNSLVGIAAMDGYEDETPETAGDNYHMDEATPGGVAFAVLSALWNRERTGAGGLLEFPQSENVMQEIGEFFLAYQQTGRQPQIIGNTDPYFLQDVFPCSGDDRWVAISIRDDRDWSALSQAVGAAPWLADGVTAELRAANSRALRASIAEWTRDQPSDEVLAALRARGVPAGEVMSETRLLDDPQLSDREWLKLRSHPAVGTHLYPGHPWRAAGFDTVFGRPVPGFGEDNEYVYKKLLGYPDAVYEDLVARKLVTGEQLV